MIETLECTSTCSVFHYLISNTLMHNSHSPQEVEEINNNTVIYGPIQLSIKHIQFVRGVFFVWKV